MTGMDEQHQSCLQSPPNGLRGQYDRWCRRQSSSRRTRTEQLPESAAGDHGTPLRGQFLCCEGHRNVIETQTH